MSEAERLLLVITGPTASGKTALSIEVARRFGCHILSADSRQLFRDLPIGTAAPDERELAAVPHHFIGTLGLDEYYSAACYEQDALKLLEKLWSEPDASRVQVVCGGSGMYVDALVRGIDEMPTVSEATRAWVSRLMEEHGLEGVLAQLEILDPVYSSQVDRNNPRRVMHAVEICLEAGKPYSELRTGQSHERPFKVLKFALDMPRETLFGRINSRVEAMMAAGLEDEARRAFASAGEDANSLRTVGYRELLEYFHGRMSLDEAKARIAKNTRVYAKKQLTLLRRDPSVRWIPAGPAASDIIISVAEEALKNPSQEGLEI